jgi:DNA gyrase subunit A
VRLIKLKEGEALVGLERVEEPSEEDVEEAVSAAEQTGEAASAGVPDEEPSADKEPSADEEPPADPETDD